MRLKTKLPYEFRLFVVLVCICTIASFRIEHVSGASLLRASDAISTSRPSSLTTLSNTHLNNAKSIAIIDNGSVFFQGDTASILASPGERTGTFTIASASASNIPTSGKRMMYSSNPIPYSHAAGDMVAVRIPAMHTISFTTGAQIRSNGKIVITFPGLGDPSDIPSATTFAFNNLSDLDIQSNNATCGFSVIAPRIICGVQIAIPANTTVTIFVGCAKQIAGVCTSPTAKLLNPTTAKSKATADIWNISLRALNPDGTEIESSRLRIGTIQSVQVKAFIDPTLSFSLIPVGKNLPVNTGNTNGCNVTEKTHPETTATSTSIDLGKLENTPSTPKTSVSNIAAQLLSITTNARTGYVLFATSSGHLQNRATGFTMPDSLVPGPFEKGKPWFGMHACGKDVSASIWTGGLTQVCNTYITGSGSGICRYGWPTTKNQLTLASDPSGPIGEDIVKGNGKTTIEFAAGIDQNVAGGNYNTSVTYTILPTF